MKKLILLFQFIWLFSFSQEIKWSTVYEQKNSSSKLNFIGKTNSEIFLISQESKGFFSSTHKSILVFDDSLLQFKRKNEIELNYNNNQLNYLRCFIIDNQIVAFYSKPLHANSQIYSMVLHEKKWGEPTLLFTVPFIDYSNINLHYFESFNSLFFYGVRKQETKNVNQFSAFMYNMNTKKETTFSVDLESDVSKLDFTEIKSDSCCNIVLVANYYQKKTFSITNVAEIPVAIKLNTINSQCKIINLKAIDASQDFTYLLNSKLGILINKENGKPDISIVDFTNDNSSQIIFNSESNKTAEPEEDYALEKTTKNSLYEKDFKNLKIKNVFQHHDSSFTVVCEQSWTEQICNTLNYRFGGIQCFNYYYSMDLLVFYFSSSGILQKMNRLQKPQITIDDGGVYNSIISLNKEKEVFIIYNDEPSNAARKIGRLKTMMYPLSSVLTSITINKNGLINSQRLSSPKQENIILRPSKSFYVNSSEALVIATKNNKFKIGKIKI
jgi:hypothetical protein